jgi:hypothetical protein
LVGSLPVGQFAHERSDLLHLPAEQ